MDAARSTSLVDGIEVLVDALADVEDVAAFLHVLVGVVIQVLDASLAGVLVGAPEGGLRLAAGSSPQMEQIEQLELSLEQGPCVEAYRDGGPVLVPDLQATTDRWPGIVPPLLDMGMGAGFAFPMRCRGDAVGALNVYRSAPGELDEDDRRLAQALADLAAFALLERRTVDAAEQRAAQLQQALDSRVVVEQAKGALAQCHGITPLEAFELLRRHARSHRQKLDHVSALVIDGELRLEPPG